MIRIYNTLTRQKQEFVPLHPPVVAMYVCGMTVYDYCHVGHARVMVAFDCIARYLRFRGYQVRYVRNITDIDDKIIQRARARNQDWRQLTQEFIDAMHEDAEQLAVEPPDVEPRATEYMAEMINLNDRLIRGQHAYVSTTGDVLFSVRSFDGYGRLGRQNLDDLRAGARVGVDEEKKDPLDFVLWKAAKVGEPFWPSPWGNGRPGWHIECSAMSMCCLGEQLDLHGGGGDLVFPHHENEIAQSEAVTHKPFASTWMHVGFVNVDDVKMSKSLGNFFTIREVLEIYQPEVLRYFIVCSHYRSPLNYSNVHLDQAIIALERFYQTLQQVPDEPSSSHFEAGAVWVTRFIDAMDDDFNTPEALSVLFDLAREINRAVKAGDSARANALGGVLRRLGGILGLLQADPATFLKSGGLQKAQDLSEGAIEALIEQRRLAKKEGRFTDADAIRKELLEKGIELEDSRQGTRWRRVSPESALAADCVRQP